MDRFVDSGLSAASWFINLWLFFSDFLFVHLYVHRYFFKQFFSVIEVFNPLSLCVQLSLFWLMMMVVFYFFIFCCHVH